MSTSENDQRSERDIQRWMKLATRFVGFVLLAAWSATTVGIISSACAGEATSPTTSATSTAERVDLSGTWSVRLDPQDRGAESQWYLGPLDGEPIELPGTTDERHLGEPLDAATMRYAVDYPFTAMGPGKEESRIDRKGHLVRPWMYLGQAWYQRTITVPEALAGKHFTLRLERVLWKSQVWLDDRPLGDCDSLATPHEYDLGVLAAGEYRLTVAVDNRKIHDIEVNGHSYGPETQSRWNGLVGDLQLVARDPVHLQNVRIDATGQQDSVQVRIDTVNAIDTTAVGTVAVRIVDASTGKQVGSSTTGKQSINPGEQTLELEIPLETQVSRWDEFSPKLYTAVATLEATVGSEPQQDSWSEPFGFRTIARDGNVLYINGRKLFLRGTLDCCVFPRTGYPPTNVDEWEQLLGTVQQYGFNHVRFHTWCPPEAAFVAADRLGVYLQPETLYWDRDFGSDEDVVDFVRREIRRICDAYGNHPSFVLFCIGNEFNGQVAWLQVDQIVADAKSTDPRRLYSGSTARKSIAADDFWVTHSTGKAGTRGIGPNRTDWDFSEAAQTTSQPLIAHETGQRPVFPDYEELLPKFDGPLRPYNYERLREEARAAGLTDRFKDFERASARFQLVQYKAEHEAMLRTPSYAGYQLLMLGDFPGQAEALVGILDPFLEEKGVVTAEEVRAWNNPTVPLARFAQYEWSSDETLSADLEVAHYGPHDLVDPEVRWSIRDAGGRVIAEERLVVPRIETGTVTSLGAIRVPLSQIGSAERLTLRIAVGDAVNSWPLWVYPAAESTAEPEGMIIATQFDKNVEQALQKGGRVLLVQGERNHHNGESGFFSQYWSGGWWGNRFSHLGLVCDPNHPALSLFPNDGYSDWQWYGLFQRNVTWDLTEVAPSIEPVLQLVSDFHHNRNLAQVFEARIGSGRLLACGYDISRDLEHRHAARQLRRSLIEYCQSERFDPNDELDLATARELFQEPWMRRLQPQVAACDSEASGHEARLAVDGDPKTFWHTPWQGHVSDMPHSFEIELNEPADISGIRLLGRQDGNQGGRTKEFAVYVSSDGETWQGPVVTGEMTDDQNAQEFATDEVTARYIRFEAHSSHEGKPWASLAELELLPVAAQRE